MSRATSRALTGSESWKSIWNPKVIVASEDDYPLEVRLPEWWAETILAKGIDLWRQGETGAVMMEGDEEEFVLRSFVDGERERILKR